MSRKKGYKKGLPTVLPAVTPPGPRAGSRPDLSPDLSPESEAEVDAEVEAVLETEPETEEPTEDPAEEPAGVGVTPPVPEPPPDPHPGPERVTPVVPRVVAPRRPAAAEVAPPVVSPPPPVVSPPPPSRSRAPAAAIAAAALLVGACAGGAATWWLARDDGPQAQPAPGAPVATAGWPAAGTSRTVTQVRADGTVAVTHRIHTTTPIDALDLSLPETSSTVPVEATGVRVVADGREATGPERITFTRASYLFDDATTILVRYRLDGVVERSPSARDRGLVTTTALTVSATQPDDVRVIRSASVLSLACGASEASLTPCGEADGEGKWTVRLTAGDAGARVVAAVTVPS